MTREEIQEKLAAVDAATGKMERELSHHPVAGLFANLRSLRKLRESLQDLDAALAEAEEQK